MQDDSKTSKLAADEPVPLHIEPAEPSAPGAQLDTPNTPDAIAPGHPAAIVTAADYIAERKASENDAKKDPGGEPESS